MICCCDACFDLLLMFLVLLVELGLGLRGVVFCVVGFFLAYIYITVNTLTLS